MVAVGGTVLLESRVSDVTLKKKNSPGMREGVNLIDLDKIQSR